MPAILGFVGAASVELCRLGVDAVFWRNGVATLKGALDRRDRTQLRVAYLHGADMVRKGVWRSWGSGTNCARAGG